jgi:large subunit ribosomal protein L10
MINDNTKLSHNREKKETLVSEFQGRVDRSKALVFANYQGLTHQQLETVKKAVKKVDAEFVATKNSLILRALEGLNLSADDQKFFEKPTATLFIYGDIVEPLKILAKTVKELNLPAVKFGVLDGKTISDSQVMKLATLPSIDVLRAQLLGQMLSPVQKLHTALRWNLQTLVMTLNAISQKKS